MKTMPVCVKALLLCGALLWAGSAPGCATIVSGTTKEITVTSNPAGARVTVDGGSTQIMTPGKIILKRDTKHILTFAMDGCEPQTVVVEKKLNGWVFGNLLFGGIFGIVIDIVSGSVNDLKPDTAHVNFPPRVAGATPTAPAVDRQEFSRNTLAGGASP
jgi:hypothetical protein